MPRNPGAKKNAHSHKHEGGLVGPGKRVTKQKSNGQLNPHQKPLLPDEPQPSTHTQTTVPTNVSTSSLTDSSHTNGSESKRSGLKQRDSDDAHELPGNHGGRLANGSIEASPHANSGPVKTRGSQDVSHLQIASSILRSSPACDTVAILIFLLALPSMVLTIIQALFASLTLIPPSGVSHGSLLSLLDVFQGSAGPPSLATMAIVDGLCLGLWFCLWNWARTFALDFAQIHIALTLGSGNSGKSNQVDSVCIGIVLLLHCIRSKAIRQFIYARLISSKLLATTNFSQVARFFPTEADFGDNESSVPWIPSLFAIHIISQALMAFVRRRVTSTQSATSAKSSRRADTEAVAGTETPDSAVVSAHNITTTGVDHVASAAALLKDGKDKGTSAKKKRRQANQVRSGQPFWAAVASTKVHVLREYEHKMSLARNTGTQDGALETTLGDEVVWVTHVDPSSISFQAANILLPEQYQDSSLPKHSQPFYVRINGARWQSVYSDPVTPPEDDESVQQWSGEINGLVPNCTYTCTFVRVDDDQEFASATVKTPALLQRDVMTSPLPPSARQALRPSSPTSGLRSSITAAEAKLNEARNRLIKTRKIHKNALTKLEREVDSYSARLKSSSDDTKQRQKLLQAEQSIRRTEDAAVSITAALDDLAAIPEEETDHYPSKKQAFDQQTKLLAAANEALATAKSTANNDLSCVQKDLTTVTDRKERLTSRHNRLTEQHDRITQANAKGMNEKDRKEAESIAKQADQQKIESDYMRFFNAFNNEIQQLQARTNQAWLEIQNHDRQSQVQREAMLQNAGPLTPEGNLPGTNPNPFSTTNRSFNFGFPPPSSNFLPGPHSPEVPQASPFLPFAKTTMAPAGAFNARPRSGTNHSLGANSNYSLEYEDPDPIPPMPSNAEFRARKGSASPGVIGGGSSGAGSSGGGGAGSPVKDNHSPGVIGQHSTW